VGVAPLLMTFAFADAMLFRELPFAAPEQLVEIRVRDVRSGRATSLVPFGLFEALSQSNPATMPVAPAFAEGGRSDTLDLQGETVPMRLAAVSPAFFSVLGVRPMIGRLFDRDEFGVSGTILLTHSFWRTSCSGQADVVGRAMTFGSGRRVVVGVLPADFVWPERTSAPDALVPVSDDGGRSRRIRVSPLIGRVRDGLNIAQAGERLQAISWGPEANDFVPELRPLRVALFGDRRPLLQGLLLAAGALVILGCLSVAGLLAAWHAQRQHQWAVRCALGASRVDLALDVGFTCAGLTFAASVIAYGLAALGILVFRRITAWPEFALAPVTADVRVAVFASGTAMFAAVLLTSLQLWRASRPELSRVLQAAHGSRDQRSHVRLDCGLIAAQVALGMALSAFAVAGAVSVWRLSVADMGFDPAGLVAVDVIVPFDRYPTHAQRTTAFETLIARLKQLPQVTHVGAADYPPTGAGGRLFLNGQGTQDSGFIRAVTPGYFAAMGLHLRQGRLFSREDIDRMSPVAVINEKAARLLFGAASPIGRQLREGMSGQPREIVGVVSNSKTSQTDITMPFAYVPFEATTGTLVVRGDASSDQLLATVGRSLAEREPGIAVKPWSVERQLSGLIERPRVIAWLFTGGAACGLGLATLAVFGVVRYHVRRRRCEMGIRMALGACPFDVTVESAGLAVRALAWGWTTGLLVAIIASRIVRGTIAGAFEPTILSYAVATTLCGVATLGGLARPVMEALHNNPADSLRES
jgi:predicted permease